MGKMCRKVSYPNQAAAMASKWRHNKRGRGRLLVAYNCPKCKKWHLGNTSGTKAANLDRIFESLPQSDRATQAP